jgi:uncharacterized membrane protein YedE/YeeE
MEFTIHHQVLLAVLLVAAALGAAMHKTRFCTMGGVSDWVNMGHTGRLGAWFFAIAIATGGVLLLEAASVIAIQNQTLGASFPPYRTAQFAWLRYLVGGLLFGIGMTLAGGCGSRTIVRVGGGSLKSLTVLVVASVVSYLMLWTELYQKAFLVWVAPTTLNLARWGIPSQELGALAGGVSGFNYPLALHFVFGATLVAVVLFLVLRQRDFRSDWNNVLGGAAVGVAIVAGWLITAGPLSNAWGEYALFASEPPIRVAPQSFTFISPMGDAVNYLLRPSFSLVSFGLVSMMGVILGSLLYALAAGKFRFEWFGSASDFVNHVVGAVLLGVGGVLAMGCSIGQGITGVSTLALGSMLALAAMIFGAALTMKIQFYLLDGTGFPRAVHRAVADLRLLPKPKAI